MQDTTKEKATLCPSARPELPDAVVFGVVAGTTTAPRVAYLRQPLPMTQGLMANGTKISWTSIAARISINAGS